MRVVKIAFAGLMRSGKDTAAAHIQHRYNAHHLKFADPLYEILHSAQGICGIPRQKDRKFLQWIGTEWGRSISPTIWVDILIRRVRDRQDHPLVISDARFANEFEALKKEGFLLVKMERPAAARLADEPNLTWWQRFLHKLGIKTKSATHASEQDVQTYAGFDAVINNENGSLEDLYKRLDALVEKHFS